MENSRAAVCVGDAAYSSNAHLDQFPLPSTNSERIAVASSMGAGRQIERHSARPPLG